MYYPKSQIKTSLYTNGGEYFREDTREEYKGYYWKNSRGEFYVGKTPNETPLVALSFLDENDSEELSLPKSYSSWVDEYPSTVVGETPGLSPKRYYPTPTTDDYKVGIFTRYFTKKSNQNIYYEISKDSYDKIINQDSSIKWELYEGVQLNWVLTGDKEEVYKTNRDTVILTENQNRLPGFRKIFRKDYLQYYKD